MILATAGGAGYAPIAPGTIGSAVGVALFAALSSFEFALYALTVAALGALGTWAADRAEVFFDRTDDGRIVIDEVVGQLVTLAPLTLASARALDGATWLAWVVTGFVLFRVLDVWKPGPVRWAERRFGGGVGVMLDDAIAGALAAGVLLAGVLAQGARG